MADDIVTRLRVIYCAADDLTPCGTCLTCRAADEIEGLRELGDSLVEALQSAQRRHPCNCADGYDARIGATAINDWKEARRG